MVARGTQIKLSYIEMNRNDIFTSNGVIQLLRGYSLLRSLNLRGCSAVTSDVLDIIADLSRDMLFVDVTKCRISSEESDEFLKRVEGRIKIVCFLNLFE